MLVDLKFFMDSIVRIFTAFNEEGTVLLMHFSWFFWVKYIVRRIMEMRKSGIYVYILC